MKILHSADWHLDSPILGRTDAQTALLKSALLALPRKVAAAAKAENCDLVLLSGDIFDGPYTPESLNALKECLEEIPVPVFIAPGNHDYLGPNAPWQTVVWPENVYIFTSPTIESVALPQLNCRVYGCAFSAPEAAGILDGFCADCPEEYAIGIFHGDPTQTSSPYCAITAQQVRTCGLDYLALGHIHKGGSFQAGRTLCAWPGSPMGRGFDELDAKGVLIVTLEESCQAQFLPLDTPRFYDLQCEAGQDAALSLSRLLPALGSNDFYRITLTGESEPLNTDRLAAQLPQFPNLQLRDRTVPPMDLWASAGEDTLEGIYFRLLQQAMEGQDEKTCQRILLAAKISRQILENQEVKLP